MYTKDEIKNATKNYLIDNLGELESVIVEFSNLNGMFDELRFYENDSYFFNSMFDNPYEVVRSLSGKYNPHEAYVRIDDNLYLESLDEESYQDMLLDNVDKVVDELLTVDTQSIYLTVTLKELVTLYQNYDKFDNMFNVLKTLANYNY